MGFSRDQQEENTNGVFQKSGKCIPKSWVCEADTDFSVRDTSDEGAHCVYQTLNNPMSVLL